MSNGEREKKGARERERESKKRELFFTPVVSKYENKIRMRTVRMPSASQDMKHAEVANNRPVNRELTYAGWI